ncbi:MAG TPA: 5'-3' exonuclease H3TH domain-containing protein, partial [Spirochaetia bacterium]|nr:5'-3' exonuclease H3TH domain-containing protein [Spirochaetia bacterium]
VSGDRIVQVDRRQGTIRDEAGVREKFGVPPSSIPDYLALVGDSADGYPGLPGWGAKSTAAVLSRYGHIKDIPLETISGRLGHSLKAGWDQAQLFLQLATLRTDAPLFDSVEALRWKGPRPEAEALAARMRADSLLERARKAAAAVA